MEKEMIKRIHKMANITWDVISGDVFTLMREQGEGNILSRDEIIECVSDASYMMTHGGDKEAYKAWDALPWKEQEEILKGAFPERYEW